MVTCLSSVPAPCGSMVKKTSPEVIAGRLLLPDQDAHDRLRTESRRVPDDHSDAVWPWSKIARPPMSHAELDVVVRAPCKCTLVRNGTMFE